jgi:hypothetical protein
MKRLILALGMVVAVAMVGLGPSVGAQSTPPLIFQSGWENAGGTGCDFTKLTDGGAWDDYGPADSCSTPIVQVVTAEKRDGLRSLQLNFPPGAGANGPDFRIIQSFGARNEIYARWYTKWSNNWVWATQDHKVAIFGAGAGTSQDVYLNIRGLSNPATGRVAVHVIPTDTVLSDANFPITRGVWHLFEIHIRSGSAGSVEVRVDGTQLNLTREAGNNANASSLNTGSSLGYIKLDTTYNNYAFVTQTMQAWYDSIAVSTAGWIGGQPAGGSTSTPAPAAPLNVRVIR